MKLRHPMNSVSHYRVKIVCSGCKALLVLPWHFGGQVIACHGCGQPVRVPDMAKADQRRPTDGPSVQSGTGANDQNR
jgi:hypothetical protein